MALVTEDLPEVVRLLLEAGADVDAKHGKDMSFIAKGDGRTPLLQAAQAGHVEAAKVLIEYKADLFYKREARSILTYADCTDDPWMTSDERGLVRDPHLR